MCGIAGLLKTDGSNAESDRLRQMIAALPYRGPDASGVHVSGACGFAHARLSIIDLQSGAQPMSTVDGRLWITFNGEIFNYLELREELVNRGHSFATRSDTEVILNAYSEYGEDCVKRFNGQWAFAIWDTSERKLFLSRDRAGVRPLFYTQTKDSFLFASEVKALMVCPEVSREFDPLGMDQAFTFWVTLPPRTVFKNISQLPPGHSMTVQGDRVRVQQYWAMPYVEERESRNGHERGRVEELLHLLIDAARIRLRSDVPVGAYLSGGIDSALTTALIGKIAGERLRSFSLTFADAEFDESPYQLEASAFLGTQHSSVSCSQADIAQVFPEVIRHAESPLFRTAPAPMFLLSRLVRESGFKVVMTGEGADEAFGGYDIFKEAKIRRFWGQNLESKWRPLLLKRLFPFLQDFQRQPTANLRNFFRVTTEDLSNPLFSHMRRWELTAKLKMLFSSEIQTEIGQYDAMAELTESLPADFCSWTHFGQGEYLEAKYFLPGYLLSSQGDRMAMAHSVEGRYPFLDYRVVEFGAKLPARLKMRVLNEKCLLKQACDGLVPESIIRRPKQSYRAPEGRCFFDENAPDYVEELLSPSAVEKAGVFDKRAVSILKSKFADGKEGSFKDNMGVVAVLSTQLLATQFINQTNQTMGAN
jgi:asparagine synthase (glutamine-hydrolysing)